MKIHYRFAPLIALAALAACSVPTSSGEPVASSAAAVTANGLTASLTVTSKTSQAYAATVTVKNGSAEPAYNWQVGINLNQSTLSVLAQDLVGAEAFGIGSLTVFTPTAAGSLLSPGASTTFSFKANVTGKSSTPAVATVDGMANGSPGANQKADGIDRIARAVATGAINVAEAYENNKPGNNGDSNYSNYDGLIWSAQSYVISGDKIAFDPNVPGYAFIPVQAMAQLDAIQDSPAVASYLSAGLASCFRDTTGQNAYNFKAGVLKGFTYPGPTSGTLPGATPPPGNWSPSGYSASTATDPFTTSGAAINGAEQVTITMTSHTDYWFGILTSSSFTTFPNTAAVLAKFGNLSQSSCSPFNGPGGATANPYLVITLNGSAIPARFQGAGAQCNNGCTSTMVVDPDAYATVGAYFNAAGVVGPQPNPFSFDPTVIAATFDHAFQWASSTDLNGNIIYGIFISPVVHRGIITGFAWVQQ